MIEQTRQHHAALRDSRTRAADDDYAELEAFEDKLNELADYGERAANRINSARVADEFREFIAHIGRGGDGRDLLNSAFHLLADDNNEAAMRLIASYETEQAD